MAAWGRSGLLAGAGKFLSVGGFGLSLWGNWQEGEGFGDALVETTAEFATVSAFANVGALAGSLIAPGPGTAIGTVIGAGFGIWASSGVGEWASDQLGGVSDAIDSGIDAVSDLFD
jgi:hypothetical protein